MSERDEILPDLDEVRADVQAMGLRRYTVTIRKRVWSGDRAGEGTVANIDLVITPTPKVRQISSREVAESGGTYEQGDYAVEKITPRFTTPTTGGYTPSQLELTVTADNEEIVILLSGDDGTKVCTLIKTKFDRPFSYALVVRPRRETP